MKRENVIVLLAATLPLLSVHPVLASAGTEGASFLDIPVGAGPASLGSAYTSLAADAYAPVWNPAGLGWLKDKQAAAQHLSYLEGIHYEYFSYVHPFNKSRDTGVTRALGASIQYLGSGDITGTDAAGNSTGDFSSYYASYNLAYGQSFGERLSLGVTGKMIRAKIDDVSASAYAADLGGLYRVHEKVDLGATLSNLGNKLKFLQEGDSLPMAFRVGASYRPNSRWTAASDLVYRKAGPFSWHGGLAWRPMEMISLRAGYKTDTLKGLSAVAGVTAGLGLHLWGQEFAYAWAPYGDLGNAQYFSMLLRFGAREEERRNLIQYQQIKKHRTVKSQDKNDDMEPEYQQLMQLLSSEEERTALQKR